MAGQGATTQVRDAAERWAGDWLVLHDYCDCAGQRQVVALRLLPVMAMFQNEVVRGMKEDWEEITVRLRIYCRHAHRELARGLHRPGASAALSEEMRWRNDVGPHC